MNAMDGTNRRSRGVGKAAVAHKRLQRHRDNARDDYASNQIFEDESPFTPALDKVVLLLIMVSGEQLVERGRLEKLRKPKSGVGRPTEFWSPNFLGWLYQSAIAHDDENRTRLTQRLHWRWGHIKSQPHGPPQSLRKILWISPYKAGRRAQA